MRLVLLLLGATLSTFCLRAQEGGIRINTPPTVDTPGTGDGDDLMAMLDEGAPASKPDYVTATFKATRVVNGHSVENMGKGVMDFRVTHRFGNVNQGVRDLFGLDQAFTRIAFDFGVTDWLMVGIGRSSFMKEYDGFAKARLLRQRTEGMPVSISYVGGLSIRTDEVTMPAGQEFYFSNRVAYFNQILVARKFGDGFSLQIMPTHVHYNLVPQRNDPNDLLALGIGGRIKLNRRFTLNGEWYYRLNADEFEGTRNPLSLGVDIETGGHVFQLHFTNSTGTTERAFVGQTTGNFWDGDIRFGFNISRVFTISRPKEMRGSRNSIY